MAIGRLWAFVYTRRQNKSKKRAEMTMMNSMQSESKRPKISLIYFIYCRRIQHTQTHTHQHTTQCQMETKHEKIHVQQVVNKSGPNYWTKKRLTEKYQNILGPIRVVVSAIARVVFVDDAYFLKLEYSLKWIIVP